MQSDQNTKKSNMPDHSELTMHLACSAFKMIGADEFVVNANLSVDNKESLRAFGLFESILLMAYKEGQKSAQTLSTERIKNVVTSMRDRATDNPQGIKAETLSMFADEIELAVKLQESVSKSKKCPSCGGDCGRTKKSGCKFSQNATQRRQEDIWMFVTSGLANKRNAK